MSKAKSVFVTALVALMLAAIIAGMYLLQYKAYLIIIGLAGVYGYICASFNFCHWLGKESPLLPPPPNVCPPMEKENYHDALWEPDHEWTHKFNKLKSELDGEEPPQVESNHEIMGYEK